MKKFHRHITASILTALYLLIALTPLSPLLLKSAHIAHAVTGECSGDCEIDGCSLENRANHTCCCWQKKQKQAGLPQKHSTDSCCAPASPPLQSASTGGCCTPPKPVVTASCCAPPAVSQHDNHDNQEQTTTMSEPAHDTTGQTVFKCGSPCGKGKVLALVKLSTDEIIPYHYVAAVSPANVSTHAALSPPPLSSRTIEPPKPPPKLSLVS